VNDPEELRQIRRQALGVHIKTVAAALAATTVVYFIA